MEKVVLVGLQTKDKTELEVKNSLDELESLCLTAGALTLGKAVQKRDVPDAAYFIGRGKALEVKELVEMLNADGIIFDEQLKPIQQRNLEKITEKRVIDRTRVILDIFAFRAKTKEGKLQVERAELTYESARLANQGVNLDSQSGGIGTRRGPGERKIESDKRIIRDRIASLDREIEKIKSRRDIQRGSRKNSDFPEVAIVGYTNAGKSTLLKNLSKSDIYADDKLFATLDPITRKVKLPGGREVLFTDTVGFINKLPHDLIAAFKSTMEEILRADCILHVIDASNPDKNKHIKTVFDVLKDIGADGIPVITVYNKADKIDPYFINSLKSEDSYIISAKSMEGVKELLKAVEEKAVPEHSFHKIMLSYKNQGVISELYKLSNVKEKNYKKDRIEIKLESSEENWSKIRNIMKEHKLKDLKNA
ncbi:MAG: GTPase HflX [Endomicrobia bacterium]|nr:GTPase HflX [Endomicrobiia bacterium]